MRVSSGMDGGMILIPGGVPISRIVVLVRQPPAYGICEAAVLLPVLSFYRLFTYRKTACLLCMTCERSFKFETVVPAAFKTAALGPKEPEREVRYACRDLFRETHLLKRIIPTIEEVLAAGGIATPAPPDWVVPPAIPVDEEE